MNEATRKEKDPMETLHEAVERLQRAGYVDALRAGQKGFLYSGRDGTKRAPEDLVIEETVRFEGESDPGDSAVLFALRSRDGGMRGTFVASFGIQTDADTATAIQRLPRSPRAQGR